jgi:hypothetical protein
MADRGRPKNLTTLLRLAAKHIPDLKTTDADNLNEYAAALERMDIKTFVDASALYSFGYPIIDDPNEMERTT